MLRIHFVFSILVLTGVTLLVSSGCGKHQADLGPTANAPAGGKSQESLPDGAGVPPTPAANPELEQALAALSSEDRALAASQRECPVTEKPLGSMGTPVKVRVRDRDVLLCCEGCDAEIQANPEKYLAKLAK